MLCSSAMKEAHWVRAGCVDVGGAEATFIHSPGLGSEDRSKDYEGYGDNWNN